MKQFYRILKIFSVLIIAAILILFSASLFMQDKVAGMIIMSMNKNISTKFEFATVKLSFLRKFPKASLDLKNVVVYSSPGYDKSCFNKINTDTLLSASSVSVEFKFTDIIKGNYNIERVGVKAGYLNLFTDTSGFVNYEITAEDTNSTESDFTINLNRINLSDIRTYYNNQATKLVIEGQVEEGRLKSRISEDEIDFSAKGAIDITLFELYNFSIAKSIGAEIDINLKSSDKGIFFDKSLLYFDDYSFGLTGSVSSEDILDLSLSGREIDISGIKTYIPEKYLEKISAYDLSGVLNIESRITGLLSRTSNPAINISFDYEKGSVTSSESSFNIRDFSLMGIFSNGTERIPGTSMLTVSKFNGVLGSANFSGSLSLTDFDSLKGILQLKGRVIPAEIKDFFSLNVLTSAEGAIDINLRMAGNIQRKEQYSISDFFDLNPDILMKFDSFGIGLQKNKILINNVEGGLHVSDTITASALKFTTREHSFVLDGIFHNLAEWVSGKPVTLSVKAAIACNSLNPALFFSESTLADSSSVKNQAYSFPGDIILDLDFNIGDLLYKSYLARNISGTLSYKPRILNFKSVKLNSLEGVISGNGFIVQNTDKSFIGRGTFSLEGIDINNAFTSFRNFGQDFIKAENIEGILSGSLSVLIPMDSLMNPVIKSITAEGKYILLNGGLINFEPVKELSSFIEVSELENISFDRLENDFFIRNNYLSIPVMDVKSSAADLTINGKHSFDNDYEYHVRVLLSEILSKKIHKPKPNTTEFGAISDDGLGRTSLMLKIVSKGDDIKVSYDVKAAGSQLKNEIRNEKQTLKSILNQEYGWFKNDSTVNKSKETGTPRFKISWGEEDSTEVVTETPAEKKESPVRNLFKKNN